MTSLHKLQNAFQNYLLTGHNTLGESIVATDKVPVATRLAIYKVAYECRLLEALANNYPCLKTFLGADEFQKIGKSYIKIHPSTFRSIRWFGEDLSVFLKKSTDSQASCLAELAELEWNMSLAFDAADKDVFRMEQMAAIAPEAWGDMVMVAQPSLQRMDFYWNVVSIWQQLVSNETPEAPVKNTPASSWMLWRMDYVTRYYALSAEEAWAVDKMKQGMTFGELCEGLCQFVDEQEVGMRAASFLKGWIQSGLLAGINLKAQGVSS